MIAAGIFATICGLIAGYILHGWEFDRKLRRLEQKYDDLERRLIVDRREVLR